MQGGGAYCVLKTLNRDNGTKPCIQKRVRRAMRVKKSVGSQSGKMYHSQGRGMRAPSSQTPPASFWLNSSVDTVNTGQPQLGNFRSFRIRERKKLSHIKARRGKNSQLRTDSQDVIRNSLRRQRPIWSPPVRSRHLWVRPSDSPARAVVERMLFFRRLLNLDVV